MFGCYNKFEGICDDIYNLTLSEPGAGEMSVYRVAGADTETIQIPYTKVGVIMELDD